MADLSRGERVLCRARSLMANRGIGWSRALDIAAGTLDQVYEDSGLNTSQQAQREHQARDFYGRVAALMETSGCSATLAHRAIEAAESVS